MRRLSRERELVDACQQRFDGGTIKLLTYLVITRRDYCLEKEKNPMKNPIGKSPWLALKRAAETRTTYYHYYQLSTFFVRTLLFSLKTARTWLMQINLLQTSIEGIEKSDPVQS